MFHRSALSIRWLTLIVAVVASAFPAAALAAAPQPPSLYIDTDEVTPTGTIIHVPASGSLQAALDTAQLGDVIELQVGASWRGTFHLRNRTTGSGWITIRSSRFAELPPPGTRVTPADAPLMARLVAPGSAWALSTDEAAHHYRFVGIEITGEAIASTVQNYNFVQLDGQHYVGSTKIYQTSYDQVPHHFIFDRCYVHAGPEGGGEYLRGFVWNSAYTALVDSHVSGFKSRGADTQAVSSDNGPGPFKFVNNYLEAAGENVMFAGSRAYIPGLIPSDIEIRGNHFKKLLSWRPGDQTFAGITWSVKNLLEFKSGQRILVEDNLFEDHWAQSQAGFAIVMTPRTQFGVNPQGIVSDVMIRNNILRRTTAAVTSSGHDNTSSCPCQQSARVAILNNLFEDVGIYSVAGAFNGVLLMLTAGIQDFTFEHNTAFNTGNIVMFSHPPADGLETGFVFRNNIVHGGGYLIVGDGTGFGVAALNAQAPGWIFDHNVVTGPWPTSAGMNHTAANIPQDNWFPASVTDVGFVDLAGKDYRLAATSLYYDAGSDGKDPGADIDTLLGDPPPPPPAPLPPPLSVSITSPTPGATVSGVVTVTVSAADSAAVASLKYYLDGVLLGVTPSFTLSWDSNSTQNGAHTLAVTASDAAGNTAQASVSFAVLNVVPTTTTVSAPPVTYPSNAVITVTVSSSAGTPTGAVSLRVDNGAALTGTLSNGQAQFTLTSPSVGTHTLSASYAAQAGFAASSTTGTLSTTGVVTSTDTDPLYFSSATYSVRVRKPNAVITVLRSGPLDATVTVRYATSDGTAKAGVNYVAASGTLTFGPGVTKQTFKVQIKKGPAGQGPVTVNLTLSNPSGALLGSPSKAVLTITP